MSKYRVAKTQIKDLEALCVAIAVVGVPFERAGSLPLFDYMGKKRPQRAQVVIRRRHIDGVANDMGFSVQQDGSISVALADDYSGAQSGHLLNAILTEYNIITHTKKLQNAGYDVERRRNPETGRVELVAEKRRVVASAGRRVVQRRI